jgi:hypothetical protein
MVTGANTHGNNPMFNAPPQPSSFSLPQKTPALGYQVEVNQSETSIARSHSRDNFGPPMGPFTYSSTLPVNTGLGPFPQEALGHTSSSHLNQHQGFNFNQQPNSAFTRQSMTTPTFSQQSVHTAITTQQPYSMPILTPQQVQTSSVVPQPENTQRVRRTSVSIAYYLNKSMTHLFYISLPKKLLRKVFPRFVVQDRLGEHHQCHRWLPSVRRHPQPPIVEQSRRET